MPTNNSREALLCALKLLSLRNHSERELRQKLLKKGFIRESVEGVLEKLLEDGVLDDRKFGMEFIRSRSRRKPSGKLKMRSELQKRGIEDGLIQELLGDYESPELCLRAAEKKILTLQSKSEADQKKKLEVFLHNRGFGWQEMQTVLKQFFPAGSEDDEEFG